MRRGFTLIELLIVLAILSVLAALLFPVLAAARRGVLRSSCLANEHGLGISLLLYAQDYDEKLPSSKSPAPPNDDAYLHDRFCRCLSLSPNETCFVSLAQPYLHASAPAFCPADSDRVTGGRNTTSYEFKLWLAQGRALVEVSRPSALALLWEQWGYHIGDGHASEYERRAEMNITFLDGHTKWKRLSEANSARYGSGPNLHSIFHSEEEAQNEADF